MEYVIILLKKIEAWMASITLFVFLKKKNYFFNLKLISSVSFMVLMSKINFLR